MNKSIMKSEIIEIRTYLIKENKRDKFHKLVIENSVPMLKRCNVTVLSYGKSLHDKNSYFLIRKYKSVNEREESQNEFYSRDEWINKYEKSIMELIENYTTFVLDADNLKKI